ncbi:4'-phosphopantetheinyl transferase [Hahella sp. CCB-MM4]|uniref:4'-phosphopantetheinyl transferase family protein n=1 Tax=Hahella sp. (strain CCB-MM4) TaxID=1926491 RepID=UPI00143D671F|nr:4'-phosphopantetheinyl transferase superfamily protein [Hahella sp. CCB-MM4]
MKEPATATVMTVDRLRSAGAFISEEWFFSAHNMENVKVHMCLFSPDSYDDSLFQAFGIESPEQIFSAVSKRRMEYLAGRYSARKALREYSAGDGQVGIGPARSPVFPAPFKGSISHSRNMACSAVTQSPGIKGLGIDVEHTIDGTQIIEIGESVVSDDEARLLINTSSAYAQLFTAVFSAKESIFKALYPRVGYYFGFEYAALRHLEPDNNILLFELTRALSDEFPKGRVISTRFHILGDKVFTLAVV